MKNTKTALTLPQCKPTDHAFIHVEITVNPYSQNLQPIGIGQFHAQPSGRTFKLYCSKCGQVRLL